ncbi:hypothetical protein OSB04_015486 [Centaurea solstitialis]|uniref:Uncharacterized protein n=1 Tax=Centaurea solstitialis TaxID=347529 RepID=A0AA38TAA6_9ASTR|nr:hypothetical protein OSB04_015486 [Centaurea solstitialis]
MFGLGEPNPSYPKGARGGVHVGTRRLGRARLQAEGNPPSTVLSLNTLDEIRETTGYLKSEFEIKDIGKTWFYLAT